MVKSPTGILSYVSLAMSDVTHILGKIESGDPRAAEQFLPLVYEELRRLAAGRVLTGAQIRRTRSVWGRKAVCHAVPSGGTLIADWLTV